MRKQAFLFAILLGLALSVQTAEVSKKTARQVARNFFFERVNQYEIVNYHEIQITEHFTQTYQQHVVAHIFNLSPSGFVIVAGVDAVKPVLGYSFKGHYRESEQAVNFSGWMEHHYADIAFAKESGLKAGKEIAAEWKHLQTNEPFTLEPLKNARAVEPLLISQWDQDNYYNGWCPEDPQGPGGHAYAGCVATAMGQLMYYYRWPISGTGSYSYNHPEYGEISADFGSTTYKWNEMRNSINEPNDAIAELLFHIGVSVDMDYGPNGSGMWNHKAGYSFRTYFKYGPETQYIFRDSTNLDWDSILVANLDVKKPMYYAGWSDYQYISGHAFVCDGYQTEDYFHFNWGWSGSFDGYFYTDNLNPGGSNFNYVQEVIPDMYPDTNQYEYPLYCETDNELNGVRGTLEDGSGPKDYLDNANCSWLIKPQHEDYDSISGIELVFGRMDMEAGDSVAIFNGPDPQAPVLGQFSGYELPDDLESSSEEVFISFQCNETGTGDGFFISFESILPEYCSGHTMYNDSTFGIFDDGSGEKNYVNGTLCQYSIDITEQSYMPLVIGFNYFETEEEHDKLMLFDGETQEELGTFSGTEDPGEFIIQSGKAFMIFHTNNNTTANGWEIRYWEHPYSLKENNLEFPIKIYPNPAEEHCIIGMQVPGDETFNLIMTSLDGRNILNRKWQTTQGWNQIKLNTRQCEAGVYLLQLKNDKTVARRKVVIE